MNSSSPREFRVKTAFAPVAPLGKYSPRARAPELSEYHGMAARPPDHAEQRALRAGAVVIV